MLKADRHRFVIDVSDILEATVQNSIVRIPTLTKALELALLKKVEWDARVLISPGDEDVLLSVSALKTTIYNLEMLIDNCRLSILQTNEQIERLRTPLTPLFDDLTLQPLDDLNPDGSGKLN